MRTHHVAMWVLQWVFGLYFIAVGVMHFVVPEGLPDLMGWMYELSDTVHVLAGVAEILGGLGLILPGLTGVRPELTVYAALGLGIVMILATIWHLTRGEVTNLGTNLVNLAVMAYIAYIAYGRLRLAPLDASRPASA